ncbi:MAG: HNH endonuclease [Clostridia bacterium]|nr:HNH endonuclease [Clostridia bacterium]
MTRGDVIKDSDIVFEEGRALRREMNFHIEHKSYSIILIYTNRNNYKVGDDGRTVLHEGHNVQKTHNKTNLSEKYVDQPMKTPEGLLTENGKFYMAALDYKNKKTAVHKVKMYEKIKEGVWAYNGFFNLVDAYIENDGNRNVFKFKLEMIEDDLDAQETYDRIVQLNMEHNRLIPTDVKVAVYARDKGRCAKCGSYKNLHYDHIRPFSKGGSSTTVDNIQLLCAECNLKKHDHIE